MVVKHKLYQECNQSVNMRHILQLDILRTQYLDGKNLKHTLLHVQSGYEIPTMGIYASRFRNTQKDLARVSAMDAESYYIS